MSGNPIPMDFEDAEQVIKQYECCRAQWIESLDRLPYYGQGKDDVFICAISLVAADEIENTPNAPETAAAYADAHQPSESTSCFYGCPLAAQGKCLNVGR